jgi:hypothetical protein
MARRSTRRSSSNGKGRRKVRKVMREYKQGALRSGSWGKVRKRKQAVAIALSEARRSGAHIPRKGKSRRSSSRSK